MEEEIALLEEQLATAHADIERLQEEVADAAARGRTQEGEAAALRRRLEEALVTLSDREQAIGEQARESGSLRAALADSAAGAHAAAGRYRDLLLATEPDLPGELVQGESIAALDEAVVLARQTVAQVRQHLEQQAQSIRVPAGAPVRGAPDFSDLTPAEKIRAGLSERT